MRLNLSRVIFHVSCSHQLGFWLLKAGLLFRGQGKRLSRGRGCYGVLLSCSAPGSPLSPLLLGRLGLGDIFPGETSAPASSSSGIFVHRRGCTLLFLLELHGRVCGDIVGGHCSLAGVDGKSFQPVCLPAPFPCTQGHTGICTHRIKLSCLSL